LQQAAWHEQHRRQAGIGSVAHLQENVAAAGLALNEADFAALDVAARKAA
jgi:aryl-alcohol dehydrogenase-like predicted oxidoreductase